MMGKTHQAVGVSLAAAAMLSAGVAPLSAGFGAGLLVGWLASVLPDVDGSSDGGDPAARRLLGVGDRQSSRQLGRAGRRLARARSAGQYLAAIAAFLAALLAKVLALLLSLFAFLVGHRGLTHWGITWLCLTALVGMGAVWLESRHAHLPGSSPLTVLVLPFAVGYGSHILGDMATRSGIAVLAPLSPRRYHLLPRRWRLTTGSRQEVAFLAAWIGIATPALIVLAWP